MAKIEFPDFASNDQIDSIRNGPTPFHKERELAAIIADTLADNGIRVFGECLDIGEINVWLKADNVLDARKELSEFLTNEMMDLITVQRDRQNDEWDEEGDHPFSFTLTVG